jgi:hypothetical protein
MEAEIKALNDRDVWELVDLPENWPKMRMISHQRFFTNTWY